MALRFVGAPGVLLGPLYRQPRRWSGAGGAGERDGTRRRVAGGAVRGSLPLYRVNDGRRRSVSVRGSLGTAACERLDRDRRRARERPVARAGASLVRARRAARGGVLGSGPAQRGGRAGPGGVRGEEDRAGPGALRGRSGVQGGVSRWRARPGGAGGRRGRVTRAAEKKGRREREGRRGKRKKKKRKWKKRNGGRKKGGERWIRAGITALIAEPVGHAWRPGARERDVQVEGKQGAGYGCRVFGEQGRFRKTGIRVSRRDLELNDEKQI